MDQIIQKIFIVSEISQAQKHKLKNKYYFPGAVARTKQVGIANEKLSLVICLYKHYITG